MKSIFILLFSIFISQFICAQNEERNYDDNDITINYHLNQGRINGLYTSYYKNGIKKAQGNFENNLRIGRWIVWDSLGNKRMERIYTDPFTFKRIIPEIPKEKPIQLLNIPRYKIQYNKDGYISNFHLKESDVHYYKRVWRYITKQYNPILFEKNLLFKTLNQHISDSTIKVYSAKNDEFTEVITPEIDTSKIEVIGFKIKEDFFFDMNRVVSETRIIGVCPVVINHETNDTIDTYWVYYPAARKYLAQVSIQNKSTPEKIKTLDDLFFYRFFSGKIIKISNVYDRYIKDYLKKEKQEKEAEKFELFLIEREHNIWISLTKIPNSDK
ncbi:MAG: hypothetical protein KDD29_08620 [Flavobacteriales bacterium]|nr:hypothetical protein [Flavobacteriales bacterium]MCB9334978.1 hypothetical protein [Flavobacteriales bacterium]